MVYFYELTNRELTKIKANANDNDNVNNNVNNNVNLNVNTFD